MCVTAAAKCVGLIANGLGKKFSIFVQMVIIYNFLSFFVYLQK